MYGPLFICMCCHGKLFRHSVQELTEILMKQIDSKIPLQSVIADMNVLTRIVTEYPRNPWSSLNKKKKEDIGTGYICTYCVSYLKSGKMPPTCVMNSLQLNDTDAQLREQDLWLTELEASLISINLIFHKIFTLPRSRWTLPSTPTTFRPLESELVDLSGEDQQVYRFDKLVSRGYALPPWCTRAERRQVEATACEALAKLDGELKGKYYGLSNMSEKDQDQLIADHFLFDKPVSPLLTSAGMVSDLPGLSDFISFQARDWPDSRGIWHNDKKNFLVWVNEGDHAKVMSMQKGGNLKDTFSRFSDGIEVFKSSIEQGGNEFAYNDHHGYIANCPSNIGTGVRASVHIKLPQFGANARFDEALTKLRLSKNVVDAEAGVFDISNSDRIGFSEVQLVQLVIDGVNFLINSEKQLEAGENVNAEVDKLQQKQI